MAGPAIFAVFLLVVGLRATPVAGAIPRFGALNNAAFFGGGGGGVAPRWYMEGTPALPARRLSRSPRYILSGRDDDPAAQCDVGQHSCVEADAADFCCRNDQYCYIDSSWGTRCCSLGVTCPGSPCDADQLYCNSTSTTIVPLVTSTLASSGHEQTVTETSKAVYSTLSACCNRACSVSSFSCASTYGGQCCPYGFKCALGSRCIADPVPPTSTSVSTIVTAVPSGCTTSQVSCDQSLGGGCCGIGSTCTYQGASPATSTAVCAPNITFADGGGSHALSDGARVGIGVGVAVGAAIIIGAVTWLCIRRRRRRAAGTTASNPSGPEMQEGVGGGRQTPAAWAGTRDLHPGESLVAGLMTPRSEISGPTSASQRIYSYVGPDPIDGPFTEREGQNEYDPRLGVTPPSAPLEHDHMQQGFYSPSHVMKPVEIGGIETQMGVEGERERDRLLHGEGAAAGKKEEEEENVVYELMGSLPTPSPLSPDEAFPPMGKGPPSPTDGEAERKE
ncbi:hypothetical protein F4777DRAFT_262957 [Nemania sp. FL0916]|nr:hypothetical protein F4777DRAFT_262957 [Nemania sp. FL0916]